MEAIGWLVPNLQSDMRSGCGTQLFKKAQCFYVAMVNFNVSVYIVLRKLTRVLFKKNILEVGKDSWKSQWL